MKFYLNSGNQQAVLNADSPKEAVLKFVESSVETDEDASFGLVISVSEKGHDMMEDGHDDDLYFATTNVFKELGIELKE